MPDADTTMIWGCTGVFGKKTWAGERGVFGAETRNKVKARFQAVKQKMTPKPGKRDAEPEAHLLGSHHRTLPRVPQLLLLPGVRGT